ncbi:unnamed protein product [Spirodela intermedia]|uniref:Uncharacterized protein n=1 Tax=Spirodela intermedia TaxID=51605 RepID=A0A7I8ILU1_SPIIN|nr:unnamed protein product [Spirodela intermedia]CAA6658934.1 unnamed protein product [Spirodela intermedia]
MADVPRVTTASVISSYHHHSRVTLGSARRTKAT